MSLDICSNVEKLISSLACPPCPWKEDYNGFIHLVSDDVNEIGVLLVSRLEELCQVLQQKEKTSSGCRGDEHSAGFSLSVSSLRQLTGAQTKGYLVEEVDDVASLGEDGVKPIGMDVLLHVIGLYSSQTLRSILIPQVDEIHHVEQILTDLKGVLERHEGPGMRLVDRGMPDILSKVHQDIVAHAEFEEMSSNAISLMKYEGPNEWERYLRSLELIWLLENLTFEKITMDEYIILYRTIALGCKDVSYRVRNSCLEALDTLLEQLERNDILEPHQATLSDILIQCISANDERCWKGTYRAVARMISFMPSHLHNTLLEKSIEQAARNHHSLIFAASWLETMSSCFESAGISLMHHATILLPTLLEWVQALHEDVQSKALDALCIYLRVCWPRNYAHAGVIWDIVKQRYTIDNSIISKKIHQVAEVLWVTSGKEFRAAMTKDHHDPLTISIVKEYSNSA